jgi:hypothetical protein
MKIGMSFTTALYCIFCYIASNAQDGYASSSPRMPVHEKDIRELSPIVILEDSLVFFADSMYSAPMPEDRIEANYQFIRIFKQLLKMPESHTYPFPKLSKKINILNAPDKYFRILIGS